MKTAANLLKSKAHQSVHTITPEASVFDAIKLMADKNIGALLVMEAEEVAGIITERHYARKIVLMSRSSKQTPVREIMTSAVLYVRPDQTSGCRGRTCRSRSARPTRAPLATPTSLRSGPPTRWLAGTGPSAARKRASARPSLPRVRVSRRRSRP